jgi:DUF1009 family protein
MAREGGMQPVAILAGGGYLPPLVAAAAARCGYGPVVFTVAGEADPNQFPGVPVHVLRWGEIGRLFRLTEESGCRQAVLIGTISRRPDYSSVRPDLGAVKLLPRILKLMRGSDNSLLTGVARIFEERGVRVLSPLDVAPELALREGCLVGKVPPESTADVEKAAEAARLLGSLDIAQGAVAIGGRVVAMEDVGGTNELLDRVIALRKRGRIEKAGGVLVKCVKPSQDRRLDLPTIGPMTAQAARRAGLTGVAAEAGLTLLAGRTEAAEAFSRAGLFLLGLKPPLKSGDG